MPRCIRRILLLSVLARKSAAQRFVLRAPALPARADLAAIGPGRVHRLHLPKHKRAAATLWARQPHESFPGRSASEAWEMYVDTLEFADAALRQELRNDIESLVWNFLPR